MDVEAVTGKLSQELAGKIWNCHREIKAGEGLLEELAKYAEEHPHDADKDKLRLVDAFGQRWSLQLGAPSGTNSHRLFGVHDALGVAIIKAHIATKRAELVALSEAALLELRGDTADAE